MGTISPQVYSRRAGGRHLASTCPPPQARLHLGVLVPVPIPSRRTHCIHMPSTTGMTSFRCPCTSPNSIQGEHIASTCLPPQAWLQLRVPVGDSQLQWSVRLTPCLLPSTPPTPQTIVCVGLACILCTVVTVAQLCVSIGTITLLSSILHGILTILLTCPNSILHGILTILLTCPNSILHGILTILLTCPNSNRLLCCSINSFLTVWCWFETVLEPVEGIRHTQS